MCLVFCFISGRDGLNIDWILIMFSDKQVYSDYIVCLVLLVLMPFVWLRKTTTELHYALLGIRFPAMHNICLPFLSIPLLLNHIYLLMKVRFPIALDKPQTERIKPGNLLFSKIIYCLFCSQRSFNMPPIFASCNVLFWNGKWILCPGV